MRGRIQSRELPGRCGLHRGLTGSILVRHQEGNEWRAARRTATAPVRLSFRGAVQQESWRRGCSPGAEGRHQWELASPSSRKGPLRHPGLLKFHTGAFTTAIRAGCPLVPATVRGTRIALSPSGGLPRPQRIEVRILDPIAPPPNTAEDAAIDFRDLARAMILAELGEPDLTCSGDTAPPPHIEPARSAPASRP